MGVLLTLAWRENGLMKWNIFVNISFDNSFNIDGSGGTDGSEFGSI